ncbi:hypothetical protein [Lacimicrobium alkaliphilum]|uniref:Porin domain-containing protein n=1 Tax=Lacimicrobium alkaliphilum TaxID=1526571 RepID=A0A0U2RN21_9ALTE|nr:hypothetical protein [Lacimicrobium alkaliphilum]ALS98714.1 hypothetical protein AT746_10820 [Lacimicrobium alkaliphilum]
MLCILPFWGLPAYGNENVQWSGFGSLAVVTADSDELGYRRDYSLTSEVFDGQWSFEHHSNLGVQVDWHINSQWDVTAQLLYRSQRDINLDTLTNLAFLRYAPDSRWRFRAGRLPFDLFLMTEYRDIGFAHSFAKVPSELYGIIPHRHIDGIDAEYHTNIAMNTLSVKAFYGETKELVSAANTQSGRDFKLDDVWGLAIDLKSFEWELGLNHTRTRIDNQVAQPLIEGNIALSQIPFLNAAWPDAVSDALRLNLDNESISFTSFGGQYHFPAITLQGEIAHMQSTTETVNDLNSGYLAAIYNYGSHQFTASVSHAATDRDESLLEGIDVGTLSLSPDALGLYIGADFLHDFYNINQNTLSVGWRWNFNDTTALKVQWDRSRIYGSGSSLWQPPVETRSGPRSTGTVNALFVEVSWVF